jgi:DeoR/GlpR family transcriptional regulator of sugar metabolism
MGTQILAALTKAKSIEDAVDTLVEEYDVDETTLRHDLTSFIEQLVAQGLIEVSDGNPV